MDLLAHDISAFLGDAEQMQVAADLFVQNGWKSSTGGQELDDWLVTRVLKALMSAKSMARPAQKGVARMLALVQCQGKAHKLWWNHGGSEQKKKLYKGLRAYLHTHL